MATSDRYTTSRPSVAYPDPPLTPELEIDLPAGTRWGLCLSHDVDHLGLREHLIDGFLVRYAGNLVRQNLLARFRPFALADRLWGLALAPLIDRWDVVDRLLERERRCGVRSTWFMAVRPGLGIAYRERAARRAAETIRATGMEIALHSQCPEGGADLLDEITRLSDLSGSPVRGLRMHYLRLTRAVFDAAERAGLIYDSTVMDRSHLAPETIALDRPRRVRPRLFELPLHVMDSTLFSTTGLGLTAGEAIEYTTALIERARAERRVIVVNLHPNYYSRQSREIRTWYDALLDSATSRSDVFLTDMHGLASRVVDPSGATPSHAEQR